MTLPASGPISLGQIADEFGLPHMTPFPSGFYGKGGAPSSGPLSFADFYGRSAFTLSADRTSIAAESHSASQTATITSTISTTFTYTLTAGSAGGHVTTGATSGATATVTVSAPATGTGSVSGTYRVTAANGDYLDIGFTADWGTA